VEASPRSLTKFVAVDEQTDDGIIATKGGLGEAECFRANQFDTVRRKGQMFAFIMY